ncbi:hypothetical protein FPZ12_026045 [Amycolatopsis acidicola]|uniref:Uncharacterized protein n=1 Tax=Amycolatopsis acidicola TaxID=2596893 RepID=A0A5N0UVS4_9PSEU|nr:hypothetical protein [Amycolatopsis acidicola]KAA9157097.1 hypothetical protein FPZ12_026045 [Amycolatopsis acidicola]
MAHRGVWGLLLLVVALVLVGCESGKPAAAKADPGAAVDGALTSLGQQAAVAYRIGEETLNVTRTGLAQGTLSLKDQQVKVLRAGGVLYLRAPAEYWQAQGMQQDRATEYGSRWARSVLAFELGGTLAPADVARTLRAAVTTSTPAERTMLADGTDVFDVGGLRVTATQPYRVVSIDPALLGPAVVNALGTGPLNVDALDAAKLTALHEAFGQSVQDLAQPFVAGPVIATTVSSNDLKCAAAGSCIDTVQVENKLIGDAPDAAARLVLKSSVTSAQLGAKDCGQELVTPLNGSATMTCSVQFALPKLTGSAKVEAVPTVAAEPVAVVDPAALDREVAADLG